MNAKTFQFPCLRGIGQIMLQNNVLSGLLFFIGIFINSPLVALGGLVATAVGTFTAKLLKYNDEEINSGLYGFNAALIGVGLITFYQAGIVIWLAIIILSVISAIIMNACLKKGIPVFTFPFIALTWLALFVFNNFIPISAPSAPEDYVGEILAQIEPKTALMGHGLGFGEVIFQSSLLSGLIFFVAVYISSPKAALYGLFGALFGMIIAVLLKDRIEDVKMGLFSFNAVLCAIVFGGDKKKDILFVILAILISGVTEDIFLRLGLSALTFPFVLGTWVTLFVKKRFCPEKA